MPHYPITFAEQVQPITVDLGEQGNAAREQLEAKGFEVVAGLTLAYAAKIAVMGAQPHIEEFCPKDKTAKRFGTLESTAQWLRKGGDEQGNGKGRGMFILRRSGTEEGPETGQDLVGYGWTGVEPCAELPMCETTFAVRVGEEGRGKGLAKPFTSVIVAGSAALFGARDMGLETWKGNGRAVSSYTDPDVGFRLETEVPGARPTLREAGEVVNGKTVYWNAEEGKPYVEDTRLFMSFPNDRLPQAVLAA